MKKILIVSCEASGDLHGAEIINEIKKENKEISFFALGSSLLKSSGAKIIYDAKKLSVMGLTEILPKLHVFIKLLNKIPKIVKEKDIDLVILIDSPDFNLRVAGKIKKIKPEIKIVYYISPTIWAWRYNRINIIKKYIDKMLVILPFEEEIYRKESVDAVFVGHPLTREIDCLPESPKNLEVLNKKFQIAIVPGSRLFEVEKLSRYMVEAAEIIRKRFPLSKFLVARAESIDKELLEKVFPEPFFTIVSGNSYDLFKRADCAIIKSGTSTLEAGLMGLPMVIIYRFSWPSFFIGKYILRIKKQMFGLVNILSEKKIVKELFQNEVSSVAIADEVLKILSDKDYYDSMSRSLFRLKENLLSNKTDASKEVLKLL